MQIDLSDQSVYLYRGFETVFVFTSSFLIVFFIFVTLSPTTTGYPAELTGSVMTKVTHQSRINFSGPHLLG